MPKGKSWTEAETEYLEEAWGTKSIPAIAKHLGRSINAVKLKAQRIGLRRHIHSGDYITLCQLCRALKISYSTWTMGVFKNNNFPVKRKKSIKAQYRIVYMEDFWEWAERNKMMIDFGRVEKFTLGPEAEWVAEKRKADIKAKPYVYRRPWTKAEDDKLKTMLKAYRFNWREISVALQRCESAIQRRMNDLNIKQRPLKAGNQNKNKWTEKELAILEDLYYKGYIAEVIAEYIPRSAKAINGKLERMVKEGLLHPTRYLETEKPSYRMIEQLRTTPRGRRKVEKLSDNQRATLRRFGTQLLNTVNQAGVSPNEENIHEFMRIYRELNRENGILSEAGSTEERQGVLCGAY